MTRTWDDVVMVRTPSGTKMTITPRQATALADAGHDQAVALARDAAAAKGA